MAVWMASWVVKSEKRRFGCGHWDHWDALTLRRDMDAETDLERSVVWTGAQTGILRHLGPPALEAMPGPPAPKAAKTEPLAPVDAVPHPAQPRVEVWDQQRRLIQALPICAPLELPSDEELTYRRLALASIGVLALAPVALVMGFLLGMAIRA